MPGSTLFTDAMALTPAGDGVYDGELNQHWTIGPKVHGGAMLALCANAALKEHSRGQERWGHLPPEGQGTTRGSNGAGESSRSRCRATSYGRLTPGRCVS
jgi:hypothetical protein